MKYKSKKQNKMLSFVSAAVILAVTAFITVLLFSFQKDKFQILDTDIEKIDIVSVEYDVFEVASEYNKDNVEEKLTELYQKLKETGVNTIIIPVINQTSSLIDIEGYSNITADTKLLNELVELGAENQIQVLVSIDNEAFDMNNIINIVNLISKDENVAGVVIENSNLTNDEILELEANLQEENHLLAIKNANAEYMNSIISNTAVDYFIFPASTDDEFISISEGNSDTSKVLMHYDMPDFEKTSLMIKGYYNVDGVVFTNVLNDYTVLNTNTAYTKGSSEFPTFNFDVSNDFKVTNPLKNETTYYSGIFITGVGEENGIITVNGEEYTSQTDGTFGIYYDLSVGSNTLEISQNDNTHTVIITRKTYSSSGSDWEPSHDGTLYADENQVVVATRDLTSILNTPDDDGDILAGVPAGTQMIVRETVETVRSGYTTYAYKLSGGGYVLAKNAEFVDSYSPSEISGGTIEVVQDGDEAGDIILTFNSTGNPAVISFFEEDRLTFAFLDTTLGVTTENLTSDMFSGVNFAISEGTNATITLTETNNSIWGYYVSQTDTTTTIYLKKPPQKVDGAQPLLGTSIVLDAGHGDQDSGTVGVAGGLGPTEKDLNLAVTLVAKEMLEEYGATVHLVREDDTFFELEERRMFTNDVKADLFISLHHNSMAYSYNSNNAMGAEIYYFTKQSESFANALVDNISLHTNRKNRGSEQGYYYVTRVDIAPAVLMEYSFLMNPNEYSLTYSDEAIYNAAYGTVVAILESVPEWKL